MVKQMEDRHSIWIRIFHWSNMIAITMLTLTGFYIHAPQTFRLFSNMDTPRTLHFAMAYVLLFGVIGRVYYAIVAKDAHNLVFRPVRDTLWMPSLIKYYLFMTDEHPYYGKYNPGQRGMYTGLLVFVIIMVMTGFVMYKPNTFMFMSGWFGGYITARLIHYVLTWIILLCVMVHLYLDFAEGLPGIKSIFTGKIPVGFHHGPDQEESH